MKKFKFVFAALIGVMVLAGTFWTNSESLQGLLKKKNSSTGPKVTMDKVSKGKITTKYTYLDKPHLLQASLIMKSKLTHLKSNLKPALKNYSQSLNVKQKKIDNYTFKLATANEDEQEQFTHIFEASNLADQVSTISKWNEIGDTSKALNAKMIKTAPKNVSQKTSKMLNLIQGEINVIVSRFEKNDLVGAEKKLSNLSALTLPMLLTLEGDLKKNNHPDYNYVHSYVKTLTQTLPSEGIAGLDGEHGNDNGVAYNDHNPKIAFCIMDWNNGTTPLTEQNIQTILSESTNYFNEVSYGNYEPTLVAFRGTRWDGDLPADRSQSIAAAVASCDDQIDFSQIDGMVVYPSPDIIGGIGGKKRVVSTEGAFKIGVVTLGDPSFTTRKVVHELGHALFGFPHSDYLACNDKSFVNDFVGCKGWEYGNVFDTMGGNGTGGQATGHYNGWFKRNVNWLSESLIPVQGGTFELAPLEITTRDPQLLRIRYTTTPLCIEYRKPTGLDSSFSQAQMAQWPNAEPNTGFPDDGMVFLYICREPDQEDLRTFSTLDNQTLLIDATPHQDPENDNHDNPDRFQTGIPPNTPFSNGDLGLSLSWVPDGQGNASVTLVLADPTKFFPDLAVNGKLVGANCREAGSRFDIKFYNNSEWQTAVNVVMKVYGIKADGTEVRTLNETTRIEARNFYDYRLDGEEYVSARAEVTMDEYEAYNLNNTFTVPRCDQ